MSQDAKSANGAPASGERRTVVEDGTQFKGALASNCPVIVRGHVEGELSAPSLIVSGSGTVHGAVKVGELRSEGELAGEFDAESVQLSGRVKDHTVIRARTLEVRLATGDGKMQVVFGECALEVGEAPSREAAAGRARETTSKEAGAKESGGGGSGPKPGRSVPPPNAIAGEPRASAEAGEAPAAGSASSGTSGNGADSARVEATSAPSPGGEDASAKEPPPGGSEGVGG